MITVKASGSFSKIEAFLSKMSKDTLFSMLHRYGQVGVDALKRATPIDSGMTRDHWSYTVEQTKGRHSITWHNDNTANGVPIAILLQYGHGTGTGGYVQGRDYINPAIRPIFDRIAEEVWKGVTNA